MSTAELKIKLKETFGAKYIALDYADVAFMPYYPPKKFHDTSCFRAELRNEPRVQNIELDIGSNTWRTCCDILEYISEDKVVIKLEKLP